MPKCLVAFCKNSSQQKTPNVHFFTMHEKRYNSWMTAMGRDPLAEKLSHDNLICSEHFRSEDIIFLKKRAHLKKFAVPCLKLKGSDFVVYPAKEVKREPPPKILEESEFLVIMDPSSEFSYVEKTSSGNWCAAKFCSNTSRKNRNISFFTFPKDPERAKVWVTACGREELMDKVETLHRSHRICGRHFENRMFLNDLKNRLHSHAVPTIFPSMEGSSAPKVSIHHAYSEHDYCRSIAQKLESPKSTDIDVYKTAYISDNEIETATGTLVLDVAIQDEAEENNMVTPDECEEIILVPSSPNSDSTFHNPSLNKLRQILEQHKPNAATPADSERNSRVTTSHCSTQTPSHLTSSIPKINKLRQSLKQQNRIKQRLESQNKKLKTLLSEAQARNVDNITLDQYMSLTHKFCNNNELAMFINAQVSLSQKCPKRGYSVSFRRGGLALYFTSPKYPKKYLVGKFSLVSFLARQLRQNWKKRTSSKC